jgi:hypothetical protein
MALHLPQYSAKIRQSKRIYNRKVDRDINRYLKRQGIDLSKEG